MEQVVGAGSGHTTRDIICADEHYGVETRAHASTRACTMASLNFGCVKRFKTIKEKEEGMIWFLVIPDGTVVRRGNCRCAPVQGGRSP